MAKASLNAVENDVVEKTPSLGKSAVEAVKKGASAARQAAESAVITPVKLARKAVYGVCYGVSYGTVYSALMIGKAFPADSVVSQGMHDGLETAIKDFEAAKVEKIIDPDMPVVNT